MEKYFLPGRIEKIHGASGRAVISTIDPVNENLNNRGLLFIEIEGKKVPFFIESLEIQGERTIIVKLEGYDRADRLKDFTGCNVFFPLTSQKKNNAISVFDLKGYTIISENENISGTVVNVADFHGNILLEVRKEDGLNFLIPFHKDLIIEADHKNKTLKMNLPDGISELNL
ncbi:MAG TPA: ribosome maturation factor RimM [Bacteroidales bacterium]|nr:16S rRNA processing protein RimM [Bacteroidales bacterium]HRC89980.1 ribosome maturation factor RimM [Bacteroidales bacterium]